MQYIKDTRFEKLGIFMYSHEEGTLAYDMKGQVSNEIKKERYDNLMQVQQEISQSMMKRHVGKTLKVLVDDLENLEEKVYSGRSEYDAPEVDGLVYIHADKELKVGDFVNVKISDSCEYDLIGDLV